jgi:hypothetical protein
MLSYVHRLPAYLSNTPAWVQLAEAMDEVLGPAIREPATKLANIRDVNNWHPKAFAAKVGVAILDGRDRAFEGEVWNDPSWRVRTAMMLGFNFYNIYSLSPDTYDQFIKMAVQFYPEQGTNSWIDFLGFATNSLITVTPLWTSDYHNFYAEGSSQVGTPIYDGGDWYPTSHVDVKINANFSSKLLLADFYDLLKFAAPINLVFRDVSIEFTNVHIEDLQIAIAGYVDVMWGIFGDIDPKEARVAMSGFMQVDWPDAGTVPLLSTVIPTNYSGAVAADAYVVADYVATDSGNILDI